MRLDCIRNTLYRTGCWSRSASSWSAAAVIAAASMVILSTGNPVAAADEDPIHPANAQAWVGESGLSPTGGPWDNALPAIPSQGTPDPMAVTRAVMSISQNVASTMLGALGIGGQSRGGVSGSAAIERVIQRGGSQIGVPFSWGGGSVNGPTKGIDSGAGTVGFDCSGLTMYSFAGAGVRLPKYSGDQYKVGTKVPTSRAKRGDLLFWGPGGSQHVALYLGNGMMLEAPYTGATVHVAKVRTSGMTPDAVRVIPS